jgi:signal transduction histidine kinase
MFWVTDFLNSHITEIYFIYGLGFFIMGLTVALESGHASALPLARATPWLAGFGLLHGAAEWSDMLIMITGHATGQIPSLAEETLGIGLEFISFIWLLRFGCELLSLQSPPPRFRIPVIPTVLGIYVAGIVAISVQVSPTSVLWIKVAEVWTSYAAGIPAFAFTVWGLVVQSRSFRTAGAPELSREMTGAAIAFSWYMVFDSVFVPRLPYFPASVVNSTVFMQYVGIPIQLVRAVNAVFIAFFFIRALRIFAEEDRRRLQEALASQRRLQASAEGLNRELREAANEMSTLYEQLRQRDEVHSYLLKRVVRAQEEERRRVARDLHDGVGQTLSGLAAGLGALEARQSVQDPLLRQQLENMKKYSMQSLDELHRLIADLRPSLLDELGLVAALRWYARHYGETIAIAVSVEVQGRQRRLPSEIEIILFRIAQEALTNVVRHARANTATIRLNLEGERAILEIEDDGIGFDPGQTFATPGDHRPWGLLGMQERAALVGGSVDIQSKAWQGTKVTVVIPLPVVLPVEDEEQTTNARAAG